MEIIGYLIQLVTQISIVTFIVGIFILIKGKGESKTGTKIMLYSVIAFVMTLIIGFGVCVYQSVNGIH